MRTSPMGISASASFDVSVPSSPQLVQYVTTPGSAAGVALAGNYVFVADRFAGLWVIDVSVPGAAHVVAGVNLGTEPWTSSSPEPMPMWRLWAAGFRSWISPTPSPDAGRIGTHLGPRLLCLRGRGSRLPVRSLGRHSGHRHHRAPSARGPGMTQPWRGPQGLVAAAPYLYVTDYGGGISVVDVSVPYAPH